MNKVFSIPQSLTYLDSLQKKYKMQHTMNLGSTKNRRQERGRMRLGWCLPASRVAKHDPHRTLHLNSTTASNIIQEMRSLPLLWSWWTRLGSVLDTSVLPHPRLAISQICTSVVASCVPTATNRLTGRVLIPAIRQFNPPTAYHIMCLLFTS